MRDLSFTIPDGRLVGLLGPSGCGKSTTLNMICGLETPTAGRIFFGQEDVTTLPPELRGVGMVFQNYALYPHLSVLQNILFPLENLKGDKRPTRAEMQKRAREAAALVQIEDLLDRRPRELSGGQQQRVAIARALVKMPRVLLLDEPLSNLDARLRLQTREEICKIQKRTGITTLFVTHDQEEAMSISDFIVVMKEGVLMQQGAPQQVYDDPANLFVARFLGTPAHQRLHRSGAGGPAAAGRPGGAGGARRAGRPGGGGHPARRVRARRRRRHGLRPFPGGGAGPGREHGLHPPGLPGGHPAGDPAQRRRRPGAGDRPVRPAARKGLSV